MTDIVERLRGLDRDAYDWFAVVDSAADEIERLQQELRAVLLHVADLRADNERLRKTAIETMHEMLRRANEIQRLRHEGS